MIAVYDKLIYFNEASKYTILRMRTDDPSVPEEARSSYTFRDRMLRFTAVGYGLPQTDSVKLELEGDWKEGKYGLQFHVENWHELVPPTTEGLLSYLSSGLLKGIGESTARSIVQRFGTDTLDVLEYHPEKLLGDPRHHGAEAGGDQDVLRRKPRDAGYYGAADTVSGHACDGDEDLSALRPRLYGYSAEKPVPAL